MEEKITKEMRLGKLLKAHPEIYRTLDELELDCHSCLQAKFENIGQAAAMHGMDPEELIYLFEQDIAEAKKMEGNE